MTHIKTNLGKGKGRKFNEEWEVREVDGGLEGGVRGIRHGQCFHSDLHNLKFPTIPKHAVSSPYRQCVRFPI
jgi:hypothetical protein